jgi:hypothetical protein
MEYNFNGAFAAGVAGGIAEALADPLSAPHRRVATQLRGNSFWQHWCNANIPLFAEITGEVRRCDCLSDAAKSRKAHAKLTIIVKVFFNYDDNVTTRLVRVAFFVRSLRNPTVMEYLMFNVSNIDSTTLTVRFVSTVWTYNPSPSLN